MVSSKDESATDNDKLSGEVSDSNSSLYSEGEKLAQGESSSQSSCPKQFPCGNLGNVGFPFSNVSRPECGLYTLNCGSSPYQTITLGQHQYGVRFIGDNFIKLFDPLLGKRICNVFNTGISFPSSPSISFDFMFAMEFYKCNHSSSNNEENDTLPAASLPAECSVIYLPFDRSARAMDLFEKLNSSMLYLQWKVSEVCTKCHYDEGQCLTDTHNNFQCLQDAGKKKPYKRFLIITDVADQTLLVAGARCCYALYEAEAVRELGNCVAEPMAELVSVVLSVAAAIWTESDHGRR
nr:LEAF RUST 10 DISEASE-RESISTANCE LOCUS RECEPTOR-LIKE PROTEIN KINASE-like 1.1 [Ipomoea batatas]